MTVVASTEVRSAAARPAGIRKLPGLDGLRAVAVIAVIVYHLDPSWLPGGYLGVDVFFVISGYLITALLLSEYGRTGHIRLRSFWLRRARRLLPALGVLLFAVVILAAILARDALGRLQLDLPTSLFYVMNWRLVFAHDTYTTSLGRPPLLQHLWSLSVEEQFYLLWPPVLILLRGHITRQRVAVACLGGAVVSALLMAVLYQPGNPSPVYFSTETHAFGLLIGCSLAAAVPPWRMSSAVRPTARLLLERAGAVALVAVLVGFALLGFDSSLTYRGGMLLVDLAAAVVVASVAHPASRLGRVLEREPLQWIGLRSYSLYLWHWPIFELLRPGPDVSWPVPVTDLVRLGLTLAAADASYRWVEQPWRQGRAWPDIKTRLERLNRPVVVAAVGAPLALVALLLATAPPSDEPAILAQGATTAARRAPTGPPPPPFLGPGPQPGTTTTGAGGVPTSTEPILAVGDSVLLAASPTLSSTFGSEITIDADVGRQVDAGVARLQAYARSGVLDRYRTVLVDLGTNGAFTAGQMAQIQAILSSIPFVVVYNVHAARPWAAADNSVLASAAAADAGQMTLVNWNAAAGAPGLLYPDGIHPDPAGAASYTRLLQQALRSAAAARAGASRQKARRE